MAYCAKCGREIIEGRQLCDICMIELQTRRTPSVNIPMVIGLILCCAAIGFMFLPFISLPIIGDLYDLDFKIWSKPDGWILLGSIILVAITLLSRIKWCVVITSVISVGLIITEYVLNHLYVLDMISDKFHSCVPYPNIGTIGMALSMIGCFIIGFVIKKNKKNNLDFLNS